jgi:hypothetical protein
MEREDIHRHYSWQFKAGRVVDVAGAAATIHFAPAAWLVPRRGQAYFAEDVLTAMDSAHH